MIQTYDLVLKFNDYDKTYHNLSVSAVKRYIGLNTYAPDYRGCEIRKAQPKAARNGSVQG